MGTLYVNNLIAATGSLITVNNNAKVTGNFAANTAGTFGTFANSDATPSVATGNLWKTEASTQTINDFDDGIAGQTICVISTAAITYDFNAANLKCGSADLVTASGDVTWWTYDATNWYLVQFMDASADMSGAGGDVTAVTAGDGLSGGGTSGAVSLAVDLNELTAGAVADGDSIVFIDANDSNGSRKEAVADVATLFAGTGLTAASSVIGVDASQAGITTLAGLTAAGTDGADLALTYDTVTITDDEAGEPQLIIKTTHTTTTSSGELKFLKDAADTEDGEVLGQITFYGEDEGNNSTQFAGIKASISESDETDEAGTLELQVAESDGTNTAMTTGLKLEGEHATDGQIDVTIAAGAASDTTVAGNLVVTTDMSVDGTANLDNTDIDGTFTMDGASFDVNATAAVTIDGQDDSNITVTASGKDLDIAVAGGSTQELRLASAGTGASALHLNASAGSVDIDSADAITVNAADEIVVTTTSADGHISLVSAHTAGVALHIDADANAGSIVDIDAGILDIDVTAGTTLNTTGFTITDITTSSATEGGAIRLVSDDGAVMADNHRLGVIEFAGAENNSGTAGSSTISIGSRIQAICRDAWDGSNNDADLEFYTTNGTTESLVLTLDSDSRATFTGPVTATGVTAASFEAGTSVITDDSIVMTPSTDDTVTIAAATNGALAITTVDTNAAAANITITADGTFEAIGTTVTLDSGGAINLEPAAGSAILLDGTISVDAGVVTGATSVTVGTTVVTDDSIVMTPSTSDTVTIAAATDGALNITTVDNAAHGANLTLTIDGDTLINAEGKLVARAVGTATAGSGGTNIANSFSFIRPVLKVTADTALLAGDSGALVMFNDAAATITLPDSGTAANLGAWYTFVVVNGDAGTKKIIVADTSNEVFAGLLKIIDTDSSSALTFKPAAGASNVSITFNGTTTGIAGTAVTIVATAADEWTVIDSEVLVTGDPSSVTPFATS